VAAQRPEPGLEKAIDCAKVNVTRIVERLDYDQFAAAATAVIKKPGGTINDGCLVFHELRFNNKSDDGPGLSRAQPQESPQNTPDEHRPGPIMPPMFRDVQFSKSGEPLAPAVSRPGSQIQKGDPPIEFKVCPREQ
jgi:hypothetical protein